MLKLLGLAAFALILLVAGWLTGVLPFLWPFA
jgi:hypothetical protein